MISNVELKMKSILDKLLPGLVYMDNYRPDWLKNPNTGFNLELDRYYPEIGLGVEYNGIQHRKKNDIEQWKRDKIKVHLCGLNNVTRMVIYYNELDERKIQQKIFDYIEMRIRWLEGKS